APITERARIRIPALKGVLADSANEAWFRPYDVASNTAEIFLSALDPGEVPADDGSGERIVAGYSGQTEKSGGIAAPTMTVGGLCRPYGPFGTSAPAPMPGAPRPAVASSGLFDGSFNASDY